MPQTIFGYVLTPKEQIVYSIMLASIMLLAAILLASIRFNKNRHSSRKLTAVTVLCILSVVVMRRPLFLAYGETKFDSLIHSMLLGIQTIALGGDLDGAITQGITLLDGAMPDSIALASFLAQFYVSFCVVQHALCPLLCAFAVLKTISSMVSRFWVRYFHRGPVFFFSHINHEAILLAKSIQESLGNEVNNAYLCFASVGEDTNAQLDDELDSSGLKHALLYNAMLSPRLYPKQSQNVSCILCHPAEENNLHDLAHLLHEGQRYRVKNGKRSLFYYAFAHSQYAETIVDELAGQYVHRKDGCENRLVCMLNNQENLAVHILDKHPPYRYTTVSEDGGMQLNVLVAGSSTLAESLFRNCIISGQLLDCQLSVTVADTDIVKLKNRLLTKAPMLAKGTPLAQELVQLHWQQLETPLDIFNEALALQYQYILLAFDDDYINIQAAQYMHRAHEKAKLTDPVYSRQPVSIVYIVKEPILNAVCFRNENNFRSVAEVPCSLSVEGSLSQQYSTEVLLGHQLLRKAFFINCVYSGRNMFPSSKADFAAMKESFLAFMNSAYDRRFSVASALHIDYHCSLLEDSDQEKSSLHSAAAVEHNRWCAAVMLDGYSCPSDKELCAYFYRSGNTHKSISLLLHPCLVPGSSDSPCTPWDPQAPKDALDMVSVHLRELRLQKLKQLFVGNDELLAQLELFHATPGVPVPKELTAGLSQLTPEAQTLATALLKTLHTNYKESDYGILKQACLIRKAAMDKNNMEALRLL